MPCITFEFKKKNSSRLPSCLTSVASYVRPFTRKTITWRRDFGVTIIFRGNLISHNVEKSWYSVRSQYRQISNIYRFCRCTIVINIFSYISFFSPPLRSVIKFYSFILILFYFIFFTSFRRIVLLPFPTRLVLDEIIPSSPMRPVRNRVQQLENLAYFVNFLLLFHALFLILA